MSFFSYYFSSKTKIELTYNKKLLEYSNLCKCKYDNNELTYNKVYLCIHNKMMSHGSKAREFKREAEFGEDNGGCKLCRKCNGILF